MKQGKCCNWDDFITKRGKRNGKIKKTIISCAITGALNIPSMTDYLPITPEEIIESAIGAYKAGAAAIHLHVRVPETGEPTNDVGLMTQVYNAVREETDAVICVTTGGVLGSPVEERVAAVPALKPDLASLNAGTMNFFLPIARYVEKPKYAWEKEFVESTYDMRTKNTFKDIETYLRIMEENGTKPELECFDIGMIETVGYFVRKGVLKTPVYLQFIMGAMGGVGASPEKLYFMYRAACDILGEGNFVWSTGGAGKEQFNMCTAAMLLGGNVRVGIEDNVYLRKGVLAKTNAEQVTKMRGIIETLEREIATPDEAREILGLRPLKK